jgi:hypothetical protein
VSARAQLDPVSADKLTKILGLLGSDHPGERDAAAQAANKLVRERGLTWGDVIGPPIVPDHVPRIRAWRSADSDWRRMAQYCDLRRWSLSQKERAFVQSALSWRSPPTEKQKDWLTAIYARLHERGAGR